jgi:Tol biopolymer transport system component
MAPLIRRKQLTVFISILIIWIGAVTSGQTREVVDLRKSILINETAYIPPQCYTKTEDTDKRVHNPCYTCHTRSSEPNYINDHDLQLEYSLPEPGLVNPWRNLFEDRSQRIQAISDQEILNYIGTDNYKNVRGEIALVEKLGSIPLQWDYNGNGRWDGYIPDCYYNFDQEGFDLDPDGSETGWRAFAYYPFPGTYWPTNGSTDDILIRLTQNLRKNRKGIFDREVYKINLAVVEAIVKKRSIMIDPVDETKYDVDLDKDGQLATAETVIYDWAPKEGRTMSYVGQAKRDLEKGNIHLAAGLFPEGTEFLQSVRYIGINDKGGISLAKRMKELRYMKKRTWQTYADLEESALGEMKERVDFPDRISQFIGNAEQGVNNGSGWLLQGFIEDHRGNLRPQTFEETVYCTGCHGGLGITTDSVVGFHRKLAKDHFQRGWYHWDQMQWAGLNEPKIEIRGSGVFYEYTYYLMYNKLGNDFRDNREVSTKFYNSDGTLRQDMIDRLHDDISILLNPSPERALSLNKAYRTIVEDQDFRLGRDATIMPLKTVYDSVVQNLPTGVRQPTNIQAFGGRFGPDCLTGPAELDSLDPFIPGNGMTGPSGIRYEADWQGIIHKSRYAMDIPGVHFTFPRRLTLPTRVIVPIGNNPACLTCHRIPYPAVPGSGKVSNQHNLPLSAEKMTHSAGLRRLTTNKGQDQNGVWRPDGSMIAFTSNRSGQSQIWLMAQDGGNQQQLSRGPAVHGWPQWHPDGDSVVTWSFDPATAAHRITTIDISSGKELTLVKSKEMLDRPVFHPNGEIVAYAAQSNGNWDIWLVGVADGKTTRITRKPQMESNPLWSNDGKMLGYKVAPASGAYNLTGQNFMTFETGFANATIYRWDGPESVQMNHWSPDGSQIAYTAEVISDSSGRDQVSYMAMVSKLSLGQSKAMASSTRLLANGCTLGDRGPVFSPVGNKVAFWAWNKDNTASIWLHDLERATSTSLTTGGVDMYPQWSPDGSTILFESSLDGQIDLVTLMVSSH